jgi:hypothetical protein
VPRPPRSRSVNSSKTTRQYQAAPFARDGGDVSSIGLVVGLLGVLCPFFLRGRRTAAYARTYSGARSKGRGARRAPWPGRVFRLLQVADSSSHSEGRP